jgi:hypothetical protein
MTKAEAIKYLKKEKDAAMAEMRHEKSLMIPPPPGFDKPTSKDVKQQNFHAALFMKWKGRHDALHAAISVIEEITSLGD